MRVGSNLMANSKIIWKKLKCCCRRKVRKVTADDFASTKQPCLESDVQLKCQSESYEASARALDITKTNNLKPTSLAADSLHTYTLNAELRETLKEQFTAVVTSLHRRGGLSFNAERLVQQAIAQASAGSVWDTSHLLAAAMCKRWMSLLIGLSTVLNLFSVIYILQLGAKNNLSDGYHFRFTVLEHRTHYGLGAGINNLGLLQNWCDDFLLGTVPKVTITNKSYTLSYANRIQVNGWWFTTSNNSIDSDPVKFIKIGTSRAIWSWSGTMLLSEDFYNTTIHRLMPAVFDLSVPWVWTGSGVACAIINLVASILILRMIAMQDQIRGIRLSAYSQVLIATVQMLASVGYSQLGSFDLDLMSASSAILYFGFALVLKFAEKYYTFAL